MSERFFSIFGDSISTFEGYVPAQNHVFYENERCVLTGVSEVNDTWWMQVIEHVGGTFLANASFSGSMVEGAGFPAGQSQERVDQLAGPQGEHPDAILIFMGTNDYGWGSAAAQAAGRGGATPTCLDLSQVEQRVAGRTSEEDLVRFGAAYADMLAKMRAAYPQTKIYCLTLLPGREKTKVKPAFAYALRGIALEEYNRSIARAAEEVDAQVIDLLSYGYDYDAADGTHPTNVGMLQIAAMVLAGMEACSLDEAAARMGQAAGELFPESMRSERWCDRESCLGCEHARGTGNQWLCVCDFPR